MEFITPQLITWTLTGLAVLFLVIGFLRGYIRGTHKAVYTFVVSLVVIFGLWMLLTPIIRRLIETDISFIYTFTYEGFEFKSLGEGIEFVTKYLLGFIKEDGGVLVDTTNIAINETMLYGLIYGLAEMLLRVVLLIVILVLNWTLFRFISWIIYKFIKPKKYDKFGKKTKTKKNRLIGGAIGAVNMLFIYLILSIPLAGVFSVADNAADLLEQSKKEETEIINLSFGTEVIKLSGENITNIEISNLKPWTGIYRNSLCGKLFSIKFGGTELDCAMFDKVFSFVAADEKIAIRKEIDVVSDSVSVIKEDIIQPIMNDEDIIKALDNLSSDEVREMFTELGNLKIVDIVVPIGLESAIIYVKNDDELVTEYASIVDILETVNPDDIVVSDTIVQIGEVGASLFELVEKSGYKISELLAPAEGGASANYLDILLKVDTEAVTNVFDAIGNISIIDTIQEISFAALEDYLDSSELEKYILMYPRITLSEDGYYEIGGVKTNIKEIEGKDINNLLISLDENNNWVIEGIATDINGSENLFKIQLDGIKITDEIKNVGSLYSAFKNLGINSFSELSAFIEGGPDAEGSLDLSKFTYENIDGLFDALLSFKIISNHTDNIFVILNNFLPNEYHGMIEVSDLESDDLTSLVYAAKVVAETGVLWNMEETIKTNGELDYAKLYNVFTEVKDELAEGICGSSLVVDNINAVADYAIKTFVPNLTFDFSCINWETEGEAELKKLFNVVSAALKHGNKITSDFYSLTETELDEICDALAENISSSKLLQNNMNNILDFVSNLEGFKELGLVLEKLDNWNEEELRKIFEAVKVVVKVMAPSEEGEEKNLLVEILSLEQEDIDKFLDSEFILKTLIHNLIEMSKEGGPLYEIIIVNLDVDSPEWYDVYEGDVRVKDGELRTVLTNAVKLINGIEDFEDTDALIEKVVRNIADLSNNFGEEDDEVGDLLSSIIITDTLIYYLENLDTKVSEELAEIIIVSDNIVWKDTDTEKGELRKILAAFKDVLIDEDGNVIIKDLQEGDSNKIISVVAGLDDNKFDTILDSKIILDTIVKFIEDFSEESEESSFTIFLKDKVRDDAYWRSELKSVIKGLKLIVIDEDGNFIELGNDTKQYIDLLVDIEDEDIDTLCASEILVDTLAHLLIDLADQEDSFFVVSSKFRSETWDDTMTSIWREEIKKIITTGKVLLVDEEGNSVFDVLTGNDTNKQVQILVDIKEEKYDDLVASEIITDTIAKIIIDMGDGTITISEKVKAFTTSEWQEEIIDIITSVKMILVDEEGNVDIDNITSNINTLITNVVNLNNNPNGENDEIGTLLGSEIICDTIIEQIKLQSKENGGMLVVSDSIAWKDTIVNNSVTETGELRNIFSAISTLFKDKEIDLENIDVNGMITDIINLTNEPNGANDEVGKLLSSKVLSDTIIDLLEEQSKENGGALVVADNIKWEDTIVNNVVTETGELRNIFSAISTLFKDKEIDLEDINVNEMINDIINLTNEPNGANDEVGKLLSSKVLSDTIIDLLEEQSKENGGALVVADNIKWEDTIVNNVVTETGELRNIFSAISTLFKDKEIDLEDINVNEMINDIINLTNEPNGANDEVGKLLSSKVLSDTIIDLLEEQSKENGGMLQVADSIVWADEVQNGVVTKPGELRNIFSAISVMYKDSEIDFDSINVDEILEKAKSLNNNPNGENDEVGKLVSSKVIGDTAIAELIKLGEEGTITVKYAQDDVRWYDTISNGVITSEGELRSIFSVIPVIFTDTVDMNSINANIILDLSDTDVDKVLKSVVFSDTIETKLYELDGQSGIVVNEIADLNSEVKAIIKAANIILDDGSGNVDLDNPNFDVEKAINLTDAEQDTVLASNIIVDTIKAKLIEMSEDETSMLVVNSNNIPNWKAEIKNILGSIKMILKPDSDNKYLSNPQVDYEKIYNLEEADITKLLSSDIITDTLAIALVDTEALETEKLVGEITSTVPGFNQMSKHDKNMAITNSNVWRDDSVQNGEVHKLLTAAQILIEDEEVNINKLKSINDDEIDTVLKSRIILDTFYREIDALSEGADAVLFIKEGTVKDALEAKKFIKSIKVVLGDQDITNMDSTEFNFDKFTSLSDSEIETLTDSSILRYSAAKKVYPVLTDGALSDYVVVKGSNEEAKLDTISGDLDNLLVMVRDMEQKHNISYENFAFEEFLNAIEGASDKNAKADAIADTLLVSNIMKDSVDTMMHTVLEGQLDDEMLEAVDLDMNKEPIGGRNEWLDYDANGNGTIEENEIGEFKKIFRLLGNIDQFTNDNASNNSNITDKDEIAVPLKQVNDSKVLCGIIPMFVDKATANVETWKYNETDPLYKETLSKEEWDEEIDVISTIIALVNNEDSIANLGSIDVNDENFALDSLSTLLKEIAKSRILDISNIEDFVQTGVNDAFFEGENKVTVTAVYTGSVHSEKVDAWNHETTGEIDALISSIEKLRNVKNTSISDKTLAPFNLHAHKYMGEVNACFMGQFLDSAKNSTMLSSVIVTIVYEITGQTIQDSAVESTNFTALMVAAAKLATGQFPF